MTEFERELIQQTITLVYNHGGQNAAEVAQFLWDMLDADKKRKTRLASPDSGKEG